MHAVGQSEIVILLQCLPDEKCLPKDIFSHFVQLYRDALAGKRTAYLKIAVRTPGLPERLNPLKIRGGE